MGGKIQSRAESLLPEVLPDIIALLNEAPDFGQCGLEIIFHDSRITRIISRKEASRKAADFELAQEADRLLTGGKK
jgi:hypothetical protein